MIKGALAGLLATFPMTLFMRAAWRMLPPHEKYPLPPRLITKKLLHTVEPNEQLDADSLTALSLLFHFLFGAVAGAIYGVFEAKIPINDTAKGTMMGTAVWSGSYLGWIPRLGILPSAMEQPWRRNALMIVAHFIWGGVLGILTRMFKGTRSELT